jgi:hypothetical protein
MSASKTECPLADSSRDKLIDARTYFGRRKSRSVRGMRNV